MSSDKITPKLLRKTALLPSTAIIILLAAPAASLVAQQATKRDDHPDIELFLQIVHQDKQLANEALLKIAQQWRIGYAGIIWDIARLIRPPGPQLIRFFQLINFLEQQTGQQFGHDLEQWQDWIWEQQYYPHPDYALFKGLWYRQIDPLFEDFFPKETKSIIRLDEIDWGGVSVNGIPPLEYPEHLDPARATYLDGNDLVFGITVNGKARAYPKRILAWHELVIDKLGGTELTIVYCTLCGTVIPYDSVPGGKHLKFGTSGLLYRSNKLMFDHETLSLWNTFKGLPVVGKLVDSGLQLKPYPVVTTTWNEWSSKHPTTTVLSLETGHKRDYSEGAAYQDYFSTDDLMFRVSKTNDRLRNKQEILGILLNNPSHIEKPSTLAITADFLKRNRVFHTRFSELNLVVVTSKGGANRVYDAQDNIFVHHVDEKNIVDENNREWHITEDGLVLVGNPNTQHIRLPAQRAFWFGWYAQFPDTALIE